MPELLVQVPRHECEESALCTRLNSGSCTKEMIRTAGADFIPGTAHEGLALAVHLISGEGCVDVDVSSHARVHVCEIALEWRDGDERGSGTGEWTDWRMYRTICSRSCKSMSSRASSLVFGLSCACAGRSLNAGMGRSDRMYEEDGHVDRWCRALCAAWARPTAASVRSPAAWLCHRLPLALHSIRDGVVAAGFLILCLRLKLLAGPETVDRRNF